WRERRGCRGDRQVRGWRLGRGCRRGRSKLPWRGGVGPFLPRGPPSRLPWGEAPEVRGRFLGTPRPKGGGREGPSRTDPLPGRGVREDLQGTGIYCRAQPGKIQSPRTRPAVLGGDHETLLPHDYSAGHAEL